VHLRYFHAMSLSARQAHERLVRVCFNDYDREMAIVAVHRNGDAREHDIVAVGRLSKLPGEDEAEFSVLVSDPWQKKGLGTELLGMLVQIGRDERLSRITADILPENTGMRQVCRKLGFDLQHDTEDGVVRAELALEEAAAPASA
jgi:acetyltransferase